MPENLYDSIHPAANDERSEKAVAARALDLLRQESSKELLNAGSGRGIQNISTERTAANYPSKSYLQTWIDSGTSKIVSNEETRNTVNKLAVDFVKSASLFTGGKIGLASTFIAYGLDQARPADGWKTQMADFALGGAKGETMKGVCSYIGSTGTFAPLKGALMGMSSGAIDEVFKRETFTDPSSLNERLRRNAFNPQAVLMNAAVFTAGEGLYSGLDYAYKGAISQNQMLAGMVMGGSFGFVNGTVGEASKELQEKGTINPGKVLLHGIMDGGISAAGAGVGMKVSDPVFQQKVKDGALSVLDSLGLRRTDNSGFRSESVFQPFDETVDSATYENGKLRIETSSDRLEKMLAKKQSADARADSESKHVTDTDGNESIIRKDGRIENLKANYEAEKQRIDDSIASRFTGETRQERMRHLVDSFEAEAQKRGFEANDKALFYKQINRLLADNPDAVLSSKERADLAEQVLNHAAFPTTVDQGKNKTCNVTTVEHRMYARDPDILAQMIADLADGGKYVTASGKVIDLKSSGSGVRPDLESMKSLARQRSSSVDKPADPQLLDWASSQVKKDGNRDWASQLAEITMVKMVWADRTGVVAGNRLLTNRLFYDAGHEMIMSSNPDAFQEIYDKSGKLIDGKKIPTEAYDENHNRLADFDSKSLVYDADRKIAGIVEPSRRINLYDQLGNRLSELSNGESAYDAAQKEVLYLSRPGEITYDKMVVGNDGKKPVREAVHLDRDGKTVFLKKETGEDLSSPLIRASELHDIHTDVTGHKDNPFVVIPGSKYAERDNAITVKTPADLERALEYLKTNENFPGIIHVHTGNAPWSRNPGGGHVINLQGYEKDAQIVDVTNQWGSKEDAANGRLPLAVLAAAMLTPKPKALPAPAPKFDPIGLPAPKQLLALPAPKSELVAADASGSAFRSAPSPGVESVLTFDPIRNLNSVFKPESVKLPTN